MKRLNLQIVVLALSCVALSVALVETTLSRNALFTAFVFSIIGIIKDRKNVVDASALKLSLVILLLGVSQYIPSLLSSGQYEFYIYYEYNKTAKRLMMGAVICYYLVSNRSTFSNFQRNVAKSLFLTGFGYITCFSILHYFSSGEPRLSIMTSATTSAYIYAIESICAIYIISTFRTKLRNIALPIVLLVSYYVILLTQTRAVMLTYPLIASVLLYSQNFFNLKSITFIIAATIIFSLINFNFTYEMYNRIAHSVTELNAYSNNNSDTSLGSRFSMWRAGIYAFTEHPFGQSATSRYEVAKEFISSHVKHNSMVMDNIQYHLHNDLIDSASLRGIAGIIAMLAFFYLSIIALYTMTKSKVIPFITIAPTMLYGITDTLFIDYRFVTFIVTLISFYICCYSKTGNQQASV